MANSLKAALLSAGIAVSAALEPKRKAEPPDVRHEQLKQSEFKQMLHRLMAQEYQLNRPKWMGEPRLSVAQMMAKYHAGAKDLQPSVNEKELLRLSKEIPEMAIADVKYDDNMNPTFYDAHGRTIRGDGAELSGETKTFEEAKWK